MREKLIELLRSVQYQGNAVHGYHDKYIQNRELADYLIANGVTIQRWIPVSDPPKEDGTYIVKTARGTVTTARFYAFKSFPATKYLPACHREATWQSNRNVTHWMPLPPKEGE